MIRFLLGLPLVPAALVCLLQAAPVNARSTRTRPLAGPVNGGAAGCGIASNTLLPHRLTGREAINEGFRYELEALSSNVNLELKALIGVTVEITILTDSGSERELCGLVMEARQEIVHFNGLPIMQAIMMPFFLLYSVGRVIVMKTNKIPKWPQEIEDACAIESGDPYVKDWRINAKNMRKH